MYRHGEGQVQCRALGRLWSIVSLERLFMQLGLDIGR